MRYLVILGVLVAAVGVGLIIFPGPDGQGRGERATNDDPAIDQGRVSATSTAAGASDAALGRGQSQVGQAGPSQRDAASGMGVVSGGADRSAAGGGLARPVPQVGVPLADSGEVPLAAKPEVPLEKRAPAEIAKELLARISDATDGKLHEQDLQALAVLRDSDIDAAKLLKDEYFTQTTGKAGDVVRNSVILKALESMGTSQAKQALLEIACTEQPNAQTLGPRAVESLARITADSDELALALRAPHSATRGAAAQALAGRLLSAAAIDALASQMTSSSWGTHNLVGTAFTTDKSPAGAVRKIAAILENYPRLGGRIDNKESVPGGVFWTPTEMARSSYIYALGHMQGGENELLHQMTIASADQREPLLLALGQRGVRNARPELLKMASGAEEGFIRTMAVNSLYYIATEEDQALLRSLAENDPFERTVTGGRGGESKVYPVRYAAQQVLQKLEKDRKAS